MKNAVVDPEARTVRARRWADTGRSSTPRTPSTASPSRRGISTTGIAGLTLGGGLGWLMSKYGLAADNVLAVELVTADGEILDVTADSHPDLFWALRGGGGNFGVATTFTYKLHPLETVVGGLIAHPIEAGGDMLRFYRDAVSDCPDDLTVFAGLVHAPGWLWRSTRRHGRLPHGHSRRGERDLAPFKEWGSPAMVEVDRCRTPS